MVSGINPRNGLNETCERGIFFSFPPNIFAIFDVFWSSIASSPVQKIIKYEAGKILKIKFSLKLRSTHWILSNVTFIIRVVSGSITNSNASQLVALQTCYDQLLRTMKSSTLCETNVYKNFYHILYKMSCTYNIIYTYHKVYASRNLTARTFLLMHGFQTF